MPEIEERRHWSRAILAAGVDDGDEAGGAAARRSAGGYDGVTIGLGSGP